MRKHFSKIVYLYFAVFFTVSVQAQDTIKKPYILTVAPLSLIDLYDGASLRPGIEILLRGQFAIGFESGVYLPYLNATKIRPHGFIMRFSLKHYFTKNDLLTGRYVEGEYFFKDQDYIFKDIFEVENQRYEKHYAMKRKINGVSLRYGKVLLLGKGFRLDYYVGIGIRYLNSKSDLTEVESDAILTGTDGDCTLQEDIIRKTGHFWHPNFLLGIKIGFEL